MDLTYNNLREFKFPMKHLAASLGDLPVTEENQKEMIAVIEEMQKEDLDIIRRIPAYEELYTKDGKLGDSPDAIEKMVIDMMSKMDSEGENDVRLKQAMERFENGPEKEDDEEMEVMSATYSKKDPITKEDIKDPVKNSRCGHVYDRESVKEYIDMHKRSRQACYQCPVQGCSNKVNLNLHELIDFPEFFQYCK